MQRTTAPPASRGNLVSTGPDHTLAIGRALGRSAPPGTVIALVGELGAGKTQLAKGVAEGLEISSVVNSPTFVLMNEHVGRLHMYHIDAYRLGEPEEAVAAGLLDEREVDGVTVVEWADRLAGWLPLERIELTLTAGLDPVHREVAWEAHGEPHARLAATALASP